VIACTGPILAFILLKELCKNNLNVSSPAASSVRFVANPYDVNVCITGALVISMRYERRLRPWAAATNAKQKGLDWQFTVDNARCKLKSVYPQIKG